MSDARTERAAAQRSETRAGLLDAALRVFSRKGYHATSISDLVAEAGVARGTFYLHFESKNQVFLALLDALATAFPTALRGADTSPDAAPLHAQLVDIIERLLVATRANRAVAAILFREAFVLDSDVQTRVRQFEDALHDWLTRSLANGQRLGWLAPHPPDVVATALFGMVRQAIDRYVVSVPHDEVDLRAVADGLVAFALRGLHPRPERDP